MTTQLRLHEWDERRCPGISLDSQAREEVTGLKANVLEVDELRDGIRIRSKSYVGRVNLGSLEITVFPKVTEDDKGVRLFWRLLKYAYEFHDLRLFAPVNYGAEKGAFEDLLIKQLALESYQLALLGLHRRYVPVRQALSSPRGRIDFRAIARNGALIDPALPCIHNPRLKNCLLNQVLLGGLEEAHRHTKNVQLGQEIRRAQMLLADEVHQVRLDLARVSQVKRGINRLTANYLPSVNIVQLLLLGQGVGITEANRGLKLRGFMFDMNLFFQNLLNRFLNDNLPPRLKLKYNRKHDIKLISYDVNPQKRGNPEIQPDFAISEHGKLIVLADAKYRDLWNRGLPPSMLYQLAVYALTHPEKNAIILYPAMDAKPKEERIRIDAVNHDWKGFVIIRPVDLDKLDQLILKQSGPEEEYALRLVNKCLNE